MRLPEPLLRQYEALAPRERRLVVIGAVFAALLIVYLAVVQPIASMHTRLVKQLEYDRASLAFLRDAEAQIRAAGPLRAGPGHLRPGESILAVVSSAAQRSPVADSVQRIEQAANGGVRLTLSSARFDELVRWLATLNHSYGIEVADANIQQAQAPGTVDATLTLKAGS